MKTSTDGGLLAAVRNHHRGEDIWLRLLRSVAIRRGFSSNGLRLSETQDGRVNKWLRGGFVRYSIVPNLLTDGMYIFRTFWRIRCF
jgi:hypothetical protein